MTIKRYTHGTTRMLRREDGEWCRASDYDAEVERLQDIIARARDWVEIDSVAERILREVSRKDASHE